MSDKEDIWCCCCGDRTYYSVLEERELNWFIKDDTRGIGICIECSKVVDKAELVLPQEEEDEHDS